MSNFKIQMSNKCQILKSDPEIEDTVREIITDDITYSNE